MKTNKRRQKEEVGQRDERGAVEGPERGRDHGREHGHDQGRGAVERSNREREHGQGRYRGHGQAAGREHDPSDEYDPSSEHGHDDEREYDLDEAGEGEDGKRKIDPLTAAGMPTGAYLGGFKLKAMIPGRSQPIGKRRILGADVVNCYHVMSRTTGGDMLFDDLEKEAFVKIMRRLEQFAGVEILTYAVMGNHFHLLLRVPDPDKFLARFEGEGGEARLLEHLNLLYSSHFMKALQWQLTDLRRSGLEDEAQELLGRFKARMCRLEPFVKELKERFSRWFNKHHERRGTLWMERYKSVIVENGEALRTMAAYIDLNAVRAGLCDDPKDYRWCGYAEAMGGGQRAQRGLCRVLERPLDSWEEQPKGESGQPLRLLTTAGRYRCWLFGEGREEVDEEGVVTRPGMSREAVEQVVEAGGKLPRAQLLRCRVRYFIDGVAIGSRAFVEEVFRERRGHFGAKRKNGARRIRESEPGLFALRALRQRAVE